MLDLKLIAATDPEVAAAMELELSRQRDHIELIASENFVSPAVMAAMGSHLTNKYAEGYPGKRYYGGCQYVDIVENLARDRACEFFGAEHANVQPHSGAQANLAVYFGLLQPGDTILGMNLSHGGHLTHGSPVNQSGKLYNIVPYGVSEKDERIDYEEVRRLALEHKPKLLLAGASAYPRTIDFERLGAIAKEAGCLFMVDMAHIAGLVAAGLHPSPVPYADVVTTTTHKTLRGPRGGLILCRKELAKKIDSAIFPGTQGGPLMHVIAGKAVCLKEAMSDDFKAYQQQIVKNAAALAAEKLPWEAICSVSSIDIKQNEPGLLLFCEKHGLPFRTFTAEQLQDAQGEFSRSAFVQQTVGVDNVCERAAVCAAQNGTLILHKFAQNGVTAAVAVLDWRVTFEEREGEA